MVKATKHIVIILLLLLAQVNYAQYNGGSSDGFANQTYTLTTCGTPSQFYAFMGGTGDGATIQTYTLTTCGTPSQFYAFMGGNSDGASINNYTLTSCGTPNQYYAYMGGNGDGFTINTYTTTTCGTPSQYYAYMGGNADGFAAQTYTLTTCGTPSQFYAYTGGTSDGAAAQTFTLTACGTPNQYYAYMGGTADGFSKDVYNQCPTAPPVANFSATPTTICAGSTVNFTDMSTQSPSAWSWTFQGGTPSTYTVQNPSVVYNTPGTYSVSLTAVNGMGSNTYTVANYITVVASPTANAGSDVAICTGSSTTLTATGGTTYSWTPSIGLSATNIANPVATPTATTVYTVIVGNGTCSSTDAMTVTVNSVPVANAGSDASICIGSATTFSASGGTSYNWSPSTGLSSTTISNPTASPTVTTVYTVTAFNGACSATDALTLTVNSLPTANAGSDLAICSGSSTTLTATGGPSYSWSPATGLSSTTIANPVATPTASVNYTVTVTDGNGCQKSDAMLLTVNPLPNANAGSDATICSGNSATLTASGGTSYTWTPATGLSATNISNPVANPTTTTTYTVLVTDANSCQASDAVVVTVTSTLVANAGPSVAICQGSSTTLNGSGGSTYSWSPSTGLTNPNISNPNASPSSTTIYTLTVSSGGCSASDTMVVTVNPVPSVSVTPGGATTFCAGDSVRLSSTSATSYTWSTGANTQSIYVLTNGNYYVSVQNVLGCQNTSGSVSVTVHPIGTASITPGGTTTFCQGGSLTLTANNGASYSWTGGSTSQSINVTASGTYTVTVDDIYGCAVPSPTAAITVTVNPNPPTPTITAVGTTSNLCIGDTVIFKSSPGTSYLWSTGATTDSIIATSAGTYSVTVYNSFGCGSTSSASNLTVNDPLVDFTADSLLVFIPSAVVNFTASVNGYPPYTYQWNFGDGSTSSLPAPTHVYNTIGYDTVSLTLTDSLGCAKKLTKLSYIEVEQLFPSTAMNTGTSLDLTGVSFIDAVTGIITLTDGNCILSTDSGNTWSPLPTGNTNSLYATHVQPGKWVATGLNGTILESGDNGNTWTPFVTGTTESFQGVSLSSPSNGFAVGTNGVAFTYNGTNWTPSVSGATVTLNGVEALSSGDAIAVGDNQTILSYSGGVWSPLSSPLNFDIKGVKFVTNAIGYATGTNGIVIKTTTGGSTWNPVLTGVDIDFNSIEVEGTNNAWACGTHGIIYKTTDGGNNWTRYSVGYTATQNSVRVSNGKGHVVGHGGNGRNYGTTGTTGVFSLTNDHTMFTLQPNPAHNRFVISGFINTDEHLSVKIKDVAGNEIETLTDASFSGKYVKEVNTTMYPAGVYFIHINKGPRSWVQKLVIAK
ncbi:MAG: PKD domain-containing protein [Bacteroidia bacterium]